VKLELASGEAVSLFSMELWRASCETIKKASGEARISFRRSCKLALYGAMKSFKAKLDKLSLSGEAIPLGSCEAKCWANLAS